MCVYVAVEITSSRVGTAAVYAAVGEKAAVCRNHVCPDFIDIGGVCEIRHIRRVAARRAHVDLEPDVVADGAEPCFCLGQAEELKVDETAVYAERLQCSASHPLHRIWDSGYSIVGEVELIENDVHDGRRPDGHGLKDRVRIRIDDGVVGADIACDKFLDDIGDVGL